MYGYKYDAWDRLVKVTGKQDADVVFQTAAVDASDRSIVVSAWTGTENCAP